MSELWSFLLLGLGLGGVYALCAQSLVVVYRGSGVANFAVASLVIVGAYSWHTASDAGLPEWVAVPIGILGGAAGGLFLQGIMHLLRTASALARVVATLGVHAAVVALAVLKYENQLTFVPGFLPTNAVTLFGATVPASRFWALGITLLITIALSLVYKRTRFGVATTAVAENGLSAASVGISPGRVAAANWAIGGGLAGFAGILIVPITGLGPGPLSLVLLPALTVALLAQFQSLGVAWLGGTLVAIAQSELTNYVSAPGWQLGFPILIVIAVLAIRGKSLPIRGELADRLPRVGTGQVSVTGVVVAVGAAGLLLALLDGSWAVALTTTFATAIIALSALVITGYAGQISLAQYALAGLGALLAARAAHVLDLSFWLALPIGVAATIPIGVLVGLPALRTRGVNLAIVTLGLAVVVEQLLLSNPSYTGGLNGTSVRLPTIFGWELGASLHPTRYAFLTLIFLTAALLLVAAIRRGPLGRRFLAVRDNERAAAAMGVNVVTTKMTAFGTAAALAALGGVLLTFRTPLVLFDSFTAESSIQILVIAVIGGIALLGGPIVAGMLAAGGVTAAILGANTLTGWLPVLTGVFVILNLLIDPDGVISVIYRQGRRIRDRFLRRRGREPAAGPAPGDDAATISPQVEPGELLVEGLSVSFGGVQALREVSLAVRPGEVVGLVGPNGAGKTTLVDCISGFNRNYGGVVALNGQPLERDAAHTRARRGISRSFQSLELFDDLTIEENLVAAVETRRQRPLWRDFLSWRVARTDDTVAEIVRRLGLEPDLATHPPDLPYGRRRLAGVARAIASRPSVLMLDEPASGLDERESEEIAGVIRGLARDYGMAVLLIEHDMLLVSSTCDRVVVLAQGAQIIEGETETVLAASEVKAAYLGTQAAEATSETRR